MIPIAVSSWWVVQGIQILWWHLTQLSHTQNLLKGHYSTQYVVWRYFSILFDASWDFSIHLDVLDIFDTLRYFPILPNTSQYFPILPNTSRYSSIFLNTSRYFSILLDTSRYFAIQWYLILYASRYFPILLDTSLRFSILPDTSRYFLILLDTSRYLPILYTSQYFPIQYTSRYFPMLPDTSRYFSILPDTSRYFSILLNTSQYFSILLNTFRYFRYCFLIKIKNTPWFQIEIADLSEEEKLTIYASGNYSVTGFWVHLKRKTTSHILQIIMPSAMFVVVSWISFLMPLGGGERAGLLVTLFLVLVSMFLSVVNTAPKGITQRQETLDLPYLTLLCDNLKNRMLLQNFFSWPYFGIC
jgi:hypothetical protein